MAMSSWMESVTGRSNEEHQAWRDNYNGGWAAGDLTGLTNQQIASDRADAGERNPEVLANLPAGYRLNPNPTGPLSGRGGSGGQGVSPSQSGGGSPVVRTEPQVRRAGVGVGPISSGRLNFGSSSPLEFFGKMSTDFVRLSNPGPNQMDWAKKPLEHEQILVNGHKVVHDRGWSTGEQNESVYGEGDQPWTPTFWLNWGKATADINATLQANGYPTIGEQIHAASPATIANNIGLEGNKYIKEKVWPQMEGGWNAATDWVANQIPPGYDSTPGQRNPYAGNNPFSAPFN